MGFINSFKDEVKFLFSGKGMPYEKVCLTVAMIISVFLSVLLAGNFAKDAPIIIIDLDNSKYSRELITQIDSSEYMEVKAILNISIDEISNFIREKELDAISEEILTQFAKLRRQNFAAYISDSKSYSEAVQKREKEFNALIFRMRKDLHRK